MIEALIDKVDSAELVRDKIAEILLAESATQQALATAAGKDPRLWALRVFLERSHPWSEFQEVPDQLDAAPIVNIQIDNEGYDRGASNVVERQKSTTLYHIDCYGYGVAEDDGGSGHIAGDYRAGVETRRAVRLVRNVLMAAEYTYLGLRGTVWGRWIQSIQAFHPPLEQRSVPQVRGARISFEVTFNELSPQITGELLEELGITIEDNGEVLLAFEYRSDKVTFPTQHFNIGKVGSPSVAATPGTPDPAAMAEWSQVGIANDQTISVIHLHGIEDQGSGSMTIEVYRYRGGTHTLLGEITLAGGNGHFATAGMIPAGSLVEVEAGDYLMAQLTDYSGAGGYDGLTCDVHFVTS